MFVSRFFAFAVAALASVTFVSGAPTPEKDVLVKRTTESSVYSELTILHDGLAAPIALISSSPLSPPS